MAILKIKDGNGNIIEVPALKGDKGDKGNTPQKGVDYWTEADKTEIKDYVNQQISNSGSSHTHDNKNVLDGITADKVTGWDGKANTGLLKSVDINTITETGIYDVSFSDCTGLPTLPTGLEPLFGATMIVAPDVDGYQNRYLIVGGSGDSALIYLSETYTSPEGMGFDLAWTLMFNSNDVSSLRDELKDYVNQQLGVIENGTY